MTPQLIRIDTKAKLSRWPDYPEKDIRSGTCANFGRMLFDDKTVGLSVGLWQQNANETNWLDYPIHEFMLVLEGEVVIEEETRRTSVKAGECFVIPKGLKCRWTQKHRVRKVFVILEDDKPNADPKTLRAIKIDTAAPLEPSDPPSPAVLLSSPPPQQNARDDFASPQGHFTAGVWSTTPYTRKIIPFPRFELMHIVQGTVTMSDGAGHHDIIVAGETIFVPMGAANGWQSHGLLKKIFCIVQP
jgi:uncharacterized cupin superfamily protein